MNICYICNEYPKGPHGGVGTMTQLLSEELSKWNHSVKVIGVYDKSYPAPCFELKNGVEITRIKVNFRNKVAVVFGYWIMSRKIHAWIIKDTVDIIEAPDSYGLFSLFSKFKKPLILRANGNNTYFSSILNTPLKKKTKFYEKNLYNKAFGFCAVSSFTAKRMKELYKINDQITVIYNAVEVSDDYKIDKLTEFHNIDKFSKETKRIIFSGTLTYKKGIYELLNAVIILLEKGNNITLIINGKDTINQKSGVSVKQELQWLIPAKFSDNIIFNGHVSQSELNWQYRISSAAIFPSFAEAFAFAPLEAMAAGIPTIFSKECSGKELIIDKVDGLLIDPSSPKEIAEAIEFVIQNPEKAARMAQMGKEKVKRQFTKEEMTTRSLMFYEHMIQKVKGSFNK